MWQDEFVGREGELTDLDMLLARSLAGHGGVAFITGEAGTGKTALAAEFARRSQEAHADLIFVMGSCNAQSGIGDPYLPFREILTQLTGDVSSRSPRQLTPETADRLDSILVRSVQVLVEVAPELVGLFVPGGKILGLAGKAIAEKAGWMDSLDDLRRRGELTDTVGAVVADQNRIFEQYTAFIRNLSAEVPIALFVDDLQWADTASIGLLFYLARNIETSRVLLLGSYRPTDVKLGRPTTFPGQEERHPLEAVVNELTRYYGKIEINLEPKLDEAGMEAAYQFVSTYVDTAYSPHNLDDEFKRLIARRTRGQPLFVGELLRSLEDQGILTQTPSPPGSPAAAAWVLDQPVVLETLPTRVEAVIEERIARLEAKLQETLTVASVEGEDFTAQVLAHVREMSERELVRQLAQELERQHRLVHEQGMVRVNKKRLALYRFRHALFQKYLYDRLGGMQRTLLHEDVGNALEALYAGQTDEIAPLLAHHFHEAGVLDKAVHYLMAAGARSARGYANQEAKVAYEEVLHLLEELPANEVNQQVRTDALLGLVAVSYYFVPFHDNLDILQEAAHLAESLGDTWRLAQAYHWIGRIYHGQGNQAAAVEYFEKCLDLASQCDDVALEALPYNVIGRAAFLRAEYHNAIEWLETGIELVEGLGDASEAAQSYGALAQAYARVGQFDVALQHGKKGVTLAEQNRDPSSIAIAYLALASVYVDRGTQIQALEWARKALEVAEKDNNTLYVGIANFVVGSLEIKRGQLDQGIERLGKSVEVGRFCGTDLVLSLGLAGLSEAHLRLGQLEDALHHSQETLELARELEDRFTVADTHRLLGNVYARQSPPNWAEAEGNLTNSLEIFLELDARPYTARTYHDLATVYQAQGDETRAREYLDRANTMFEEMKIVMNGLV